MHICHICQFIGVGGLESVLFNLVTQQLKNGHQISLIVYDHDQRWVNKFKAIGVNVILDYRKQDGIDWGLVQYLNSIIDNFDIIHTHDLNPSFYLSLLKIKRLLAFKKTRFIQTTHGMEHIKQDPKTLWLERLCGLMANKIITVSQDFYRFYTHQLFTQSNKVVHIDNGVHINYIPVSEKKLKAIRDEFAIDENQVVCTYVARVSKMKGQKELIQHFNNLEYKLILVGPATEEDEFNECLRISNQNIIMTGNRDDITEILQVSDIYISNSLHEGLPISVLEAGVQNIPCLLRDIEGHAQFNRDSYCVELFKNCNEIARKIKTCLDKREELVDNFKMLIKNKYSTEAMEEKSIKTL
jgi:glycosyltransferase involved in cell wall biosynthesis